MIQSPTPQVIEQKRQWLRQFPRSAKSYSLNFFIGQIDIELSISGHHALESSQFLQNYFKPLRARPIESISGKVPSQIKIAIHQKQSSDQEWERFWASPLPYCDEELDQANGRTIVERDYCIQMGAKKDRFDCLCPPIGPKNTDSIDNLLFRILSSALLELDQSIILHSCCVVDQKTARVFFGPSGVGKSTLAKSALSNPSLTVLSEDKTLISVRGNHLFASPLPFRMGSFDSLDLNHCQYPATPISHFFELHRKVDLQDLEISPVPPGGAWLKSLYTQTPFDYWDQALSNNALSLMSQWVHAPAIQFGRLATPLGLSIWERLR